MRSRQYHWRRAEENVKEVEPTSVLLISILSTKLIMRPISVLHGQLESLLPLLAAPQPLHLRRRHVDEKPLELGRQPREVLDHDETEPLAVLLVVLVALELAEHPES